MHVLAIFFLMTLIIPAQLSPDMVGTQPLLKLLLMKEVEQQVENLEINQDMKLIPKVFMNMVMVEIVFFVMKENLAMELPSIPMEILILTDMVAPQLLENGKLL